MELDASFYATNFEGSVEELINQLTNPPPPEKPPIQTATEFFIVLTQYLEHEQPETLLRL